MKSFKHLALIFTLILALGALAACGSSEGENEEDTSNGDTQSETDGGEALSGDVKVAGSSTVYPMALYVQERYAAKEGDVNVTLQSIGSGGGFEKSTKGEIDLSNASRPIKEEEKKKAEENDINLHELTLAYDGLTVAVSSENDFVENLTVEQLRKIFLDSSDAKKWSDINPDWPDETIKIFAPGHQSGTFDYFNEVILEDNAMREDGDVQTSEDDNTLVRGIKNSEYAIGFFGYAYYLQNEDSLKALGIQNGEDAEPVKPSSESIQSGEYEPLSRPLFTYVVESALEKPQVYDYTMYMLENAGEAAKEVGYVALPEEKYQEQIDKVKELAGK
ncbi:PstS family phosphate ABC transporter substrate-binding protein [Pontibacillus salipaludis]|uniref:Phosphate-binding protein n=1 Tax=Pontibacillus salipaludis TaxID=1697394 RepID=A0ABQ1PVS7_9BACI|nr:PstS family phosphate ABC transporter substrate-binding protein [Pontibacillus salipaludis]GGD04793.1 phosphate ABC transporter substrate-binding protein [Pontibacillus salipaludis]